MQTKEEILSALVDVLAVEFEIPREKLVPEALIYDDLDLDSIDAVDLVVRIQQKTGIKVVAEDFKAIKTLGDVVNVIARLLAEQSK